MSDGAKKKNKYKLTPAKPWDPKIISALYISVYDLKEQEINAFKEFEEGKISPLLFLMYKTRLDIPMLASCTGQFKWQIKRHFKPSVFSKLSKKVLLKYAKAFDLELEDLIKIKKENY